MDIGKEGRQPVVRQNEHLDTVWRPRVAFVHRKKSMLEMPKKGETKTNRGKLGTGNGNGVSRNRYGTEEKCRDDARRLLDLLRKRWAKMENPEISLSSEAVECARLGSTFLTLAGYGEHYASGKCLRAQLMRRRKELGGPHFRGASSSI